MSKVNTGKISQPDPTQIEALTIGLSSVSAKVQWDPVCTLLGKVGPLFYKKNAGEISMTRVT